MTRLPELMHLIWLFSLTALCRCSEAAQTPSLNLTSLKRLSPCAQGLRASKDNFLIEGLADTAGTDPGEWPRAVIFELGPTSGLFETLCTIQLNMTRAVGAGCTSIPTTRQAYSITVNRTALSHMSELSGRLRWVTLGKSRHVVSNELHLGKVYNPADLRLPSLVKLVNTRTAQVQDTECTVEAETDRESTIQMCCLEFTSPCWSNISLGGRVVGWGTPCANYTFTLSSNSSSKSLAFSLSSCVQTDHAKTWNCTLRLGNAEDVERPKRNVLVIILAVSIGAILITIFSVYLGLKQVMNDQC